MKPRHHPGLCTRLARDRRGVTAVLFALLLVPLFMTIGSALDLGMAYYLQARLGHAVDAAALAVGSTVDEDVDLQDRATDFVLANYPADALGTLDSADINVSVVDDVITVSARATFDTFFLKMFHLPSISVVSTAEVIRAIKGLEVAMVLDNTGSMRSHNNIGSLRTAAETMVDILFGHETEHPNLYISIVPYAASVNPGPEALGGITDPPDPSWWPDPSDPGYEPFVWNPDSDLPGDTLPNGHGWKGCVMERTGSDLMGDASSSGWEAWAWEPDPSNDYDLDDMEDTILYDPATYRNGGTGPNLGCPSPIIPLTNVKSNLLATIRSLDAWHRGGTMSDLGMAWGQRVLSPEAPFTQGLPWDEPRWEKAVVMMTDGDNLFYKLTSDDSPNEENEDVNSDYTGIGYLDSSNPRINTNSKSTAKTKINNRMAGVCEDLKSKGVLIYTVTFTSGIDADTKEIYRNCATDPTKYFDSPTQADLEESFEAIAIELSKLRVSR